MSLGFHCYSRGPVIAIDRNLTGHNGIGRSAVEVVHRRAAGMDISKQDVKVAVLASGKNKNTFVMAARTFGSTPSQVS